MLLCRQRRNGPEIGRHCVGGRHQQRGLHGQLRARKPGGVSQHSGEDQPTSGSGLLRAHLSAVRDL